MKKRLVRLRWLVVLSVVGGLVLGGCEMVSKVRGGVYDPRSLVPGLSDLTAGRVSPEVATLVATVGPAAIEAINALAEAWERSAAEQREADQREEEQRRLRTSEAQAFYAELCTHKAPVVEPPAPAASPAKDSKDSAKDSKDAGGLLGAKGALSALTGKDSKDSKDAKDGKDSKAAAPAIDPVATEKESEAAFAAGDYVKAAGLLQQIYDLRKATLGDKHPEFARIANRLAIATLASGDSFKAIALAMQGYEIRKQVAEEAEKGKDHQKTLNANLDVADSEAVLAQVYRSSSAYDLGRTSAQRALKIRSKYLGEQHACVAQSLNDLGELEFMSAHYPLALDLYRRAFSLRRQLLPAEHRDLGQSLDNLGSIYKATGLFEESKENYARALESRRKLGENHPDVADSYHNLASLYRAMGDFASSEAYYEKALTIRKAKPGFDLAVADTQTAEAELYSSFGDFAKAEGLLDQAFQTRKRLLPPEQPELAQTLAALAHVEQAKGDLLKAEANQQQALAIWQKKLGADHPTVATGLASLGEILLAQGQIDRAEQSMIKARAIREKRLGPDHAETAASLQQLGELYYAKYDYAKAEPLFRTAIEVRKRKLGESHPDLAASLSYLGALLVATNRADEGIQAFRQAEDISEQLLDALGVVSSEARLDAVLRFLRAQDEVVYSLLDDKDASPKAAPLVLSVALMRKGRSVDEAASISRAVYQSLAAEDQELFNELRMLRAQIARQKLSGQAAANPAETKKLLDKADKLEQDLAQHSARIRADKGAPTLDDVTKKVAAALPASASLIEIVEYRSYAFKAKVKEPRWGELHYAAMVLDGKGAIQVAPLGAAEAIDGSVKTLLRTITDEAPAAKGAQAGAEVRKVSQELGAKVLDPVRPFLGNAKELVLSPDGQLNLVPFWALYDGKTYLIDRYELSYVTSGRDLLARPGAAAAAKRASPPVLLAKPSFLKGNATYDEKTATRGLVLVEDSQAASAQPVLAPRALRLKGPPSPLPGTEQEAKAIRQILPRAKLFTGADATKEKFLGLQAPGIVHVATHGFFLPSQEKSGGRSVERAAGLLTPEAAAVRSSEPLLDSMLLWANVGRPVNGQVALEPGGLATALEVAGMNLWGTQLVVLSACDTGRGRVDDLGQGVYGLRRAVMVAGAETLVTSLWQVNDEVTRDLMVGYYKRLLAGAGRGEALRQASLAVRKKHPDPRDWAPFIAIGQMGPLKGIR